MKQNWIDRYSLPLASLGLMVFSAGLDGAYLAQMMPMLGGAFGYALNVVADCSCLLLSYWYGRLRQSPKGTKRHRYALALLPAEVVGAGYSWFLSWRQLRIILPAIEPDAWQWVAPVAAGFVPLLLAFTGYAQSLLAGRIEKEKVEKKPAVAAKVPLSVPEAVPTGRQAVPPVDRRYLPVTASGNGTAQRAAEILAARPDISGSELGRQLGKSERLGRKLKAELVPVGSGNGGNAR